ncbi:MAG TPA: ribonuclease III domain-containing protein [Miltoncostaeales bacterium]|nr:ribonuclease III domain-containing protein [Miltoncostaeales bacterium]
MQTISPHGLLRLIERLDPERRQHALTHRSWARSRVASYERLEFLGDTVVALAVTQELLRRHPDASEGDLAWMRQQVVGREACARVARDLGLPEAFVAAAPARFRESAKQMSAQRNVQAALTESLIGACWEDLGPDETAPAVVDAFSAVIADATLGKRDAKTALQEHAAREHLEVQYELVGREGPAHARVFTTRVLVGGAEAGIGVGSTKQASEQVAAAEALERRIAG